MAGKSQDDPKVMDVSRPGKGKIIANSRPITAPIVSDNANTDDIKEPSVESAPVVAPSAARKVIKPISMSESEESTPVEINSDKAEDQVDLDELKVQESETENKPEEVSSEPETTDSLPTPKSDPANPIAPPDPAVDQSGAASVDEMAKAAEQKRLDAEKAKEQAEREKNLQKLIKSKQYYVPIKHGGKSGSAKKALIGILVLLFVLAGAYLTVDAKLIDNNIKLPFEIIKEEESLNADDSKLADADNDPAEQIENRSEEKKDEDPETVDKVDETATPEDRAADDNRKNELRNLQQKLETFFGDNDEYPDSLSHPELRTTKDELTDSAGNSYIYETDKNSYTLSAKLDNPNDPDAENGVYVLFSTNQ